VNTTGPYYYTGQVFNMNKTQAMSGNMGFYKFSSDMKKFYSVDYKTGAFIETGSKLIWKEN